VLSDGRWRKLVWIAPLQACQLRAPGASITISAPPPPLPLPLPLRSTCCELTHHRLASPLPILHLLASCLPLTRQLVVFAHLSIDTHGRCQLPLPCLHGVLVLLALLSLPFQLPPPSTHIFAHPTSQPHINSSTLPQPAPLLPNLIRIVTPLLRKHILIFTILLRTPVSKRSLTPLA
jgi:hypothetical protein